MDLCYTLPPKAAFQLLRPPFLFLTAKAAPQFSHAMWRTRHMEDPSSFALLFVLCALGLSCRTNFLFETACSIGLRLEGCFYTVNMLGSSKGIMVCVRTPKTCDASVSFVRPWHRRP